MRRLLPLCFLLNFLGSALAQKQLEGVWEGVITKGGLHTKDGYKFELFLTLDGQQLKGRSYVYLDDGQVVQMDVVGHVYQDRSFYLQDIRFVPETDDELFPPFYRKYQMIYSRSIWENKLEGYWQEVLDTPLHDRRRLGRIYLKKKEGSRA